MSLPHSVGAPHRNLLIGVPTAALWDQGLLFQVALASITVIFLFPHNLLSHWERWGNYFDAIGLAAFAIQGSMFAVHLRPPVTAVVVAAVSHGFGRGNY